MEANNQEQKLKQEEVILVQPSSEQQPTTQTQPTIQPQSEGLQLVQDLHISNQQQIESHQQPQQQQQAEEQVDLTPLQKLLSDKNEALKHFIILIKVQNPPVRHQIAQLIQKEVGLKYLRDNIQSEQAQQFIETTMKNLQTAKQPTQQQIDQRIQQLQENDNQSNWTDATESIRADDEDDVWMVDDQIIQAMDIDSEESGEEQDDQSGEKSGQGEGKKQKTNEVDLEELEQQFLKGKESNQDWRVGFHQKFCTSVNVSEDGKIILSGGGDDTMICYKEVEGNWKQVSRVKHTQTVTKIQVSHDSKYAVSLTENQIMCTDLTNFQTRKVDVEDPTDLLCHKQGGVLVASHGYSVSIFNLKGLDLFSTYCLDLPPSIIAFTETGKQLVAACENKLRILTPKTNQIMKVSGGQFHKEQICSIATGGNVILSGCLEGKIYCSSLNKGTVLGSFETMKGSINNLYFADSFFLATPQGDGVHWLDINKMKRIFHSPSGISATSIVQVHSINNYAISDLGGAIHFIDRRSPMNEIGCVQAGNTVHGLSSKGSQVYAACEDGYVRVFDLSKLL